MKSSFRKLAKYCIALAFLAEMLSGCATPPSSGASRSDPSRSECVGPSDYCVPFFGS